MNSIEKRIVFKSTERIKECFFASCEYRHDTPDDILNSAIVSYINETQTLISNDPEKLKFLA